MGLHPATLLIFAAILIGSGVYGMTSERPYIAGCGAVVAFMVILSIGEVVWSPRPLAGMPRS